MCGGDPQQHDGSESSAEAATEQETLRRESHREIVPSIHEKVKLWRCGRLFEHRAPPPSHMGRLDVSFGKGAALRDASDTLTFDLSLAYREM
jgi:hypothetical protein